METYEEKYKDLVKRLNKAREEKGVYTFNSVLDAVAPELKIDESEDERIRKHLIGVVELYYGNTDEQEKKDCLAWLEKQGEQKPANKVEPKFKVGDWVVYECSGETATLQIARIVGETYVFSDDSTLGVVDEDTLRLWDITKDAKAGDVLFAENFDNIGGCVFLFKGLDSWKFDAEGDRSIATGYCCTSITESGNTDFGIQGPDCVEIKRVHPASKEQRDALMKAMADAGYIFDFESKELKKIEQKPADTVEPEFHEGDMIIHKELGGDYIHNPHKIIQVDILDKKYRLEGGLVAHFSEQDDYELVESGDEKTIKEIKQFIRSRGMSLAQSKVDSWIAWLEKQCEQKHQYNSRPRYVGEEELLGTNKQGKCPFLKQELIDMGFAFTQDGDLAYPIHKVEKKEFAAWSEEDEENSKNILYILNQLKGNAIYSEDKIAENCIDWLKALKDRVQPKQEWSEEDESRMENLCHFLKEYGNQYYGALTLEGTINWLKSLRPQSHWKPSEDEMDALASALSLAKSCGEESAFDLRTLYEQLKKLREE
jgi:hypothetical protein